MNHAEPVDLTNCDREPIHIPGAIQPHGVLLALDEADLSVVQVSDNVATHLQLSVDELLGRSLARVLDSQTADEIRTTLLERRFDETNPLRVEVRGQQFDAIVHSSRQAAILELEPIAVPLEPASGHHLRPALKSLQHANSLATLGENLVQEVRRLTGFERVLLYRFDEDDHGSVIAEAKAEALDSYLGLHYPASDIPAQARRLYLENWLRIIPDARYTPSRIIPSKHPGTGEPLDLSGSVLRSVSPMHLEYLGNMGIRASMSISLIVHDRLWGLISCGHHSSPRFVPYELRSACEVIGRLASLQIAALEEHEAAALRAARAGTQQDLIDAMREHDRQDVLMGLFSRADDLMALVGAEGAAMVGSGTGEVLTCGRTPSAGTITEIARWLEDRGELLPYATSSLAVDACLPAAIAAKDVASGVLSFALPGQPHRRLLWFRPELVQTVNWGGDPRKPVADPSASDGMRLHPRKSFDLWKEEVKLRSRRWTQGDLEAARDLRRNAVEIDLERQVLHHQRAVRARDDLVAVVSHDLKNPLYVIQMQAALLLSGGAGEEPSGRLRSSVERIQRSVNVMDTLIHNLLDLAKIEAGRFAVRRQLEDVRDMIEESLLILRPLASGKHITIITDMSQECLLRADRERFFQVLSNLVGNAIKFTPEGGTITVSTTRGTNEIVFGVTDTGPGLPDEQLPHVFDRYWQARRASLEGSGLGLYIAKGIVEAHGGRIWAENSLEGGAKFMFTLPMG